MRALRFSEFGDPAAVLRLIEEPQPAPGPGQVVLRMVARPINPSDLLTISGEYGRLPSLPAVPGLEGVGRVAAVGAGVTGWREGDRAIPLGSSGTWRDYVVADAARLLPVADAVSDQSAAQFIVNPVTAWVMLVEELALGPGDWLVQTAAGSTLGRLVIQLAELRGFRTINLVRRPEQVAEMVALGGDAAFCTTDDDVAEAVRRLTEGRGATAGIEAVGGATGALALNCLRPGGTMLVYGLLCGEPIPVNSGEMLFRGLTMRGFWLSHWFQQTPPARTVAVLSELMGLMADGRLLPPVAAEYALEESAAAIAHANRPGRQGKVLLVG
jgi:NADPH:quinone reductase-like Zn-dependent oxidoreductase